MRSIALSFLCCVLGLAGAARAEEPNPECKLAHAFHLTDVVANAVKASPAAGKSRGHYDNAVKIMFQYKLELASGCSTWERGGKKVTPGAALKPWEHYGRPRPECKLDAATAALTELRASVHASPAYNNGAPHFSNAAKMFLNYFDEIEAGCLIWLKYAGPQR